MILSCSNITKSFGDKHILKQVSFHLEEHEKAAIVGINGAGKSTLFNAITGGFIADEGSITLGVEIDEERGEALFSVADTGPGIPPDKQDLVFNRFEKLDGNKKKGTGLGLAICRQIAMIVGGRIWVDSAYTGGARFVFAHPIGIDPGGENREGGGISTL